MVTIANYKVGVRDEDRRSRCLLDFYCTFVGPFFVFLARIASFLQKTTGQHSNTLGIQLLKLVGI